MVEVISMKQHEASIRFHISLKGTENGKISQEHNIHNFVVMRFKAVFEREFSDNYRRKTYISIKKHEHAKNWSLTVDVTCEILNINRSFKCSGNWCDWIVTNHFTYQWFVDVDVKINIVTNYSTIHKKIFDDETHTDFKLSADDGTVAVHKVYLAAHSDVFKAMLDGQWKETRQSQMELKGVTRQTLQYFKDFMYLGTLPAKDDKDELCALLLLATRYVVEDLMRGCMMRIMQTMTDENLDSRMEFAVVNQMHELKDNILEKIPDETFALAYANKVNALMGKKESLSCNTKNNEVFWFQSQIQ